MIRTYTLFDDMHWNLGNGPMSIQSNSNFKVYIREDTSEFSDCIILYPNQSIFIPSCNEIFAISDMGQSNVTICTETEIL